MKRIEHNINLLFQTPTEVCGPTILAMQLSFFGKDISPQEIVKAASPFKRAMDAGYSGQELATYCLSLGYKIDFYSFDGRVMDYSWKDLNERELEHELLSSRDSLMEESPINEAKLRYTLSYLNLIKAGGKLQVRPFVTSELILNLLQKGPVAAGVAFCTFASKGKTDGGFGTHSILIYGYDEKLGFLVADPTPGRGKTTISTENLLAAITAAQVEDDNLLFQVTSAQVS